MHDRTIIPALLCGSLEEITRKLEIIEGATPMVQLDVVDGTYAPSFSWPYTKQGAETDQTLSTEEEGLPLWKTFDFEADLMVSHSARDAALWVKMGAARIVIHQNSPDAHEALQLLQPYREGAYPVAIGIALPSIGSVGMLQPYEHLFDYIQVMGIARVGRQGEPFDANALQTVRIIRHAYPSMPIQVDGGVKEECIPELKAAGVTRFVVGSAIFTNAHPKEYIAMLEHCVANA